jgi:YVTN family beta-propeller protein
MTSAACHALPLAALAAMALLPPLALADEVRVYVTNSAGDSIDVIDPATNRVVQVIEDIEVPHGVGFSPDGARVYVSDESLNTLDVVERQTGRVTARVPLSGHPNNIAVTKDGGRVLVAIIEEPGAVDVVDTATLTRRKTVPMAGGIHNVYVTPDGRYGVAGSIRGKFASVIDLATEEPAWQVKFDQGVRPMAFEAGPDGTTRRMFVQLSKTHGFAVVDFATHQEVARVKLPDEPAGYGVAEGRGGTPSHGIAVAPDGKTLWVDSILANAVFAYALPDLRLLAHVSLPDLRLEGRPPVAAGPDWIAFTPDSRMLYVSNAALRSVTAIDAVAMRPVAVIPVGEVPKRSNTLMLP